MSLSLNEFRFLIYKAENEEATAQVVVMDDTVWLTQKAMAELFGVESHTITYHLREIYATHELEEGATARKIRVVQTEGNRQVARELMHYNLDVIISVGYRVNSLRATHFRMWATSVLREYMTKGFALDDDRLKQGKIAFGKDYFRELLERVRSIRASERRIWQQVTDIYAECSVDYDRDAPTTKDFYAMVQNKFHYAITHKTAAEIVFDGADASKEHMGLQTWKHAPEGRILKSDAQIAKNYLDEKQISRLERAVSGYFDYIEDLIDRETVFTMQDFAASINEFLSFRRYDILQGKGRVSHAQALEKANSEYDAFNKTQRIESDFDKEIKKMLNESND